MSHGTSTAPQRGDIETPGTDAQSIRADTLRYFHFTLGRDEFQRSKSYLFQAFALAVRDRLAAAANTTRHAFAAADARRTSYLSLEFLQGRALGNALLNLGIEGAGKNWRRANTTPDSVMVDSGALPRVFSIPARVLRYR